MAITLISIFLSFKKSSFLQLLLILLTLTGLAISTYHLGVEQHWWKGPEQCSTSIPNLDGLTQAEKLKKLRSKMSRIKFLAPCDQVNWRIFNVSAVMWSVLLYSFLCVLSWIIYEQRNNKKYFAR